MAEGPCCALRATSHFLFAPPPFFHSFLNHQSSHGFLHDNPVLDNRFAFESSLVSFPLYSNKGGLTMAIGHKSPVKANPFLRQQSELQRAPHRHAVFNQVHEKQFGRQLSADLHDSPNPARRYRGQEALQCYHGVQRSCIELPSFIRSVMKQPSSVELTPRSTRR
jgi:hypothetical protein